MAINSLLIKTLTKIKFIKTLTKIKFIIHVSLKDILQV